MAHLIPPPPSSSDREAVIRYHKALAGANVLRSGIIERYTYKSDKGELLANTHLDKNCNKNQAGSVSILSSSNPLICKQRTPTPTLTLYKVGNSSRDTDFNEVRTAYCDSTTDIIEFSGRSFPDSFMKLWNSHLQKNKFPVQAIQCTSQTISDENSDSDSDCQIVDIKDYEDEKSNDNMSEGGSRAVSDSGALFQSERASLHSDNGAEHGVIHVISDSDDPDDEDREKVGCIHHLDDQILPHFDLKAFYALNSHKLNLLPPQFSAIPEMRVPSSHRQDFTSLGTTSPERINLQRTTSTSSLKSLPKTPSGVRNIETTPPKQRPPKSNAQSPKSAAPLSPESMKSEFYSYLKINTNPLARKAEAVAQNRRSVRVKNLILQIQKNQELNNIQQEKFARKKNRGDIRKKYLKYHKTKLSFPSPPLAHNSIEDFDEAIELYFAKQGIGSSSTTVSATPKGVRGRRPKLVQSEPPQKRKYKRRNSSSFSTFGKKKEKVMYRIKKAKTKHGKKQEIKRLITNANFAANMSLGRLRCPNRILRNSSVRTTRNSLDGHRMWSPKMKARKAKLKTRMKKRSNPTGEDSPGESRGEENSSLPKILAKKLSQALRNTNIPSKESFTFSKGPKPKKDLAEDFTRTTQKYLQEHLSDKDISLEENEMDPSVHTVTLNDLEEPPFPKISYNESDGDAVPEEELELFSTSFQDYILKNGHQDTQREQNSTPIFLGFSPEDNLSDSCRIRHSIRRNSFRRNRDDTKPEIQTETCNTNNLPLKNTIFSPTDLSAQHLTVPGSSNRSELQGVGPDSSSKPLPGEVQGQKTILINLAKSAQGQKGTNSKIVSAQVQKVLPGVKGSKSVLISINGLNCSLKPFKARIQNLKAASSNLGTITSGAQNLPHIDSTLLTSIQRLQNVSSRLVSSSDTVGVLKVRDEQSRIDSAGEICPKTLVKTDLSTASFVETTVPEGVTSLSCPRTTFKLQNQNVQTASSNFTSPAVSKAQSEMLEERLNTIPELSTAKTVIVSKMPLRSEAIQSLQSVEPIKASIQLNIADLCSKTAIAQPEKDPSSSLVSSSVLNAPIQSSAAGSISLKNSSGLKSPVVFETSPGLSSASFSLTKDTVRTSVASSSRLENPSRVGMDQNASGSSLDKSNPAKSINQNLPISPSESPSKSISHILLPQRSDSKSPVKYETSQIAQNATTNLANVSPIKSTNQNLTNLSDRKTAVKTKLQSSPVGSAKVARLSSPERCSKTRIQNLQASSATNPVGTKSGVKMTTQGSKSPISSTAKADQSSPKTRGRSEAEVSQSLLGSPDASQTRSENLQTTFSGSITPQKSNKTTAKTGSSSKTRSKSEAEGSQTVSSSPGVSQIRTDNLQAVSGGSTTTAKSGKTTAQTSKSNAGSSTKASQAVLASSKTQGRSETEVSQILQTSPTTSQSRSENSQTVSGRSAATQKSSGKTLQGSKSTVSGSANTGSSKASSSQTVLASSPKTRGRSETEVSQSLQSSPTTSQSRSENSQIISGGIATTQKSSGKTTQGSKSAVSGSAKAGPSSQAVLTGSPKSRAQTEVEISQIVVPGSSRSSGSQSPQVIVKTGDGNSVPSNRPQAETDKTEEEDSNSDEQMSETSSVLEESQMATPLVINTDTIAPANPSYIPLNHNVRAKSFHRLLTQRKSTPETSRMSVFELSDSDSSITSPRTGQTPNRRGQTHKIDINKNNGAVFNAYFVHGVLVIVQERLISFWKQTALGNILGAQNMWLSQGNLQRIILDSGCVNRRSSEMILATENSVAYIELWTKEHKCVYRECPIADVFATIYYHRGYGVPDKKVLQLENIKGYGDDVRFAVIKSSREIIVSWCDTFAKPIKTLVRSYQLAADFQTISSVKEMEFVSHYISSLHNIQDCDELVLGAGNEQISVWNLRHGYLVTTLNMSNSPVQPPLESKTICLYAQCDTGFLFLIQQIDVGILRLVAVNGMTHEWKQLHSYQVPDNYKKLLGVIVESGILMTCYTNGFLCWDLYTGEILAEIDTTSEHIVLPCNKYLVAIDNYQVTVQHVMSYILKHDW